MTQTTIVVALAALALIPASPAAARDAPAPTAMSLVASAAALKPGRYLWEDAASDGAVSVRISIPEQRAYVYRGQRLVAVSTISTGKDDKPTPVGLFTILQKAPMHRSNLYESAPMPYMQRLTWDGVAMHAGRNPGFPASHGCIRLPPAFAKKLYDATEMGAAVEIVDTPVLDGAPAPRSDAQQTADANRQAQMPFDETLPDH